MNNNLPPLLNFDKYTFRCSSLGKIMGELGASPAQEYLDCCNDIAKFTDLQNKAKDTSTDTYINRAIKIGNLVAKKAELEHAKDDTTPSLPQTCISYLLEVYVSVRNGIKKDIFSKYFEKGKACEKISIDMLGELHDRPYEKCTLPRQYNEFIEGELDVRYIEDGLRLVIDMKNNWDAYVHERVINKHIDEGYEDQGQGYLELYDCDSFLLVPSLMNMPENLVQDELKRILWKFGSDMDGSEEYNKACLEFRKKCTFDHLHPRERFFEFEVRRSKERYFFICDRIKLCRKWLNDYARKRYIYVHGCLPDGIIETVEKTNFVELREVEKNLLSAIKNEDIGITKEPTCIIRMKIPRIDSLPFAEQGKPEIESTEFAVEVLGKEEVAVILQEHGEITSTVVEGIEIQEKKSELDIIKQKIANCNSEDEVRSIHKECKENGNLVKYTELQDLLIKRRDFFKVPQQQTRETPKPTQETKKLPQQEAPKKRQLTPAPAPVATSEPTKPQQKYPDEELAKIEQIRSSIVGVKTKTELKNIIKPGEVFIIRHSELCLELQKLLLELPE